MLSTQEYGKTNVRIVKIIDMNKQQQVVELTCQVLLSGPLFTESYTLGDNSLVVPTDTCKNTLYWLAKTSSLVPEEFAKIICAHFLKSYAHVQGVSVEIAMHDWTRIKTTTTEAVTTGKTGSNLGEATKDHPHSFYRGGNHLRICRLVGSREKIQLWGGIKSLLVLKTTGSSFTGFHKDKLTSLPPASDRVFSTEIDATWSLNPSAKDFTKIYDSAVQITLDYFSNHNSPSVQNTLYRMAQRVLAEVPQIINISYRLPNKHVFVYDLERFGTKNQTGDGSTILYPVGNFI